MTSVPASDHTSSTTTAATSESSTSASRSTSVDGNANANTNANTITNAKRPSAITMDVYQQLQQKRLLERQKQEQLKQEQQQQQPTQGSSVHPGRTADVHGFQPVHPYENPATQPSLEALEQIVSIVQATVPATSVLPSQPQQVQMPGPDLANIIFGSVPLTNGPDTGSAANTAVKTGATAVNGHVGSISRDQHRKSAGGISSSQSQPHTSSSPTPVSVSASGAQKNVNVKGQKAIHAIELIRIAGEILQFPPATIGTSLIYYHKYRAYLHQAYKRGERDNEATKADEYLFATACLHLACKCTEVSRKVRDLVNVTYRVMNPGQPVLSLSTKPDDEGPSTLDPLSTSGTSSQQSTQHTYPTAPPPTAATYWHIRDSLLTTELMLLRILQFDLDVSLPFGDVLRIYKGMGMVFSPTDDEAAQLYPNASNFDVFLPALQQQKHHHPSNTSSTWSPSKHGAPPSSSSSSSAPSFNSAPHTGIHPTLSALAQISTTFCVDALCSSNIALNSSSRALAMGSIYLAIRSIGLELPLPFEEWCHAWGRPMIAAGFGVQANMSGPGAGIGAGVAAGVSGVNGIMGLASGANNLFVSSPRPSNDNASFMEGLELTGSLPGTNGISTRDSIYSQTQSPVVNHSQPSSSLPASIDSSQAQQDHSGVALHAPMTIVDEVRKVVQELGSFYTR
ncbi:hypothetical protein BGZ51_009722 [Haplosporangium sp. Z 767]|nr:hypothetical protein BGZ51_009722 [Haplosporangium sp. Z 767]KAF9194230.1 hypothetical protein BGZ50_006522 [Haplosporangium sp. Z 11]